MLAMEAARLAAQTAQRQMEAQLAARAAAEEARISEYEDQMGALRQQVPFEGLDRGNALRAVACAFWGKSTFSPNLLTYRIIVDLSIYSDTEKTRLFVLMIMLLLLRILLWPHRH